MTWNNSTETPPPAGKTLLITFDLNHLETDYFDGARWIGYDLPADYPLFWMDIKMPTPEQYESLKPN